MEFCCWSFRCPNAQTFGSWLASYFGLPSGNRGTFAWTGQVYGGSGQSNYHSPAATGISWINYYQNPGQRITKPNTEPHKCHWLPTTGFQGSKSLSQLTSQCVPIMLKANNDLYKKNGFSTFDHTWVRKKTHINKLDGWKHDGWVFASG